MTPTLPRASTLHGIAMMICAAITIAVLWAVLRYTSGQLNPLYIVFWRSIFGALVLAPWVGRQGIGVLRTRRLPLHFVRSLTGLCAMIGIFYSVANIPLSQAMAINYSGPLFATLGAIVIFREAVHRHRMVALAAGFVGMLIVLRPGADALSWGTAAALFGAVSMAGSMLAIRALGETERSPTIVVYGNTLSLPVAFALALVFWQWPTWPQFGLLIIIGAMSTLAQLFLNRALAVADTGAVLPFDFLRLLFVSVLGAVFFAQSIDAFMWLGGGIILCSTIYIAQREAAAARPAGPPEGAGK